MDKIVLNKINEYIKAKDIPQLKLLLHERCSILQKLNNKNPTFIFFNRFIKILFFIYKT